MKKLFLSMITLLTALGMSAAVEYPAGSGIYYDWDGDGVFHVNWVDGSVNLGDVVIPEIVTIDGYDYTPMYFGQWTDKFWGNTTITSLTIEAPIAEIAGWKFQNCTNLASVTITGNVGSIGEQAFGGCSSLLSVTLPTEGLTSIAQSAFWGDPIENITIPASVTTMGGYIFGGNSAMTNVTFLGVPEEVGPNVFTWDETEGYGKFFVSASYWNAKALKEVLDVNNGGLMYKLWDVEINSDWNNGNYIITAYTDNVKVTCPTVVPKWTPIMLPFYLTQDQLIATFGQNVEIARLASVSDNSLDFSVVALNSETGMNANTPYLIHIKNNSQSAPAVGTHTMAASPTDYTFDYVWLSDDYSNSTSTVDNSSFVGSLNGADQTVPEGAYYLDSNAEIAQSDGTAALKGVSGYFTSDKNIQTITVDGNVVTAIERVNSDVRPADNRIFNLQGVELREIPQSGIYIQNGKKLIAK